MHRAESGELLRCNACGCEVGTRDAPYAFGEEGVLCAECALERGGTYDADLDSWTRARDVSDLRGSDR